jgi:hypothetical protein
MVRWADGTEPHRRYTEALAAAGITPPPVGT